MVSNDKGPLGESRNGERERDRGWSLTPTQKEHLSPRIVDPQSTLSHPVKGAWNSSPTSPAEKGNPASLGKGVPVLSASHTGAAASPHPPERWRSRGTVLGSPPGPQSLCLLRNCNPNQV